MKDKRAVQEAVGARMKHAAQEKRLTAAAIAKQMGLWTGSIHKWWTGTTQPKPEAMDEYARLVGKPMSWFYSRDVEPLAQMEAEVLQANAIRDLLKGHEPAAQAVYLRMYPFLAEYTDTQAGG